MRRMPISPRRSATSCARSPVSGACSACRTPGGTTRLTFRERQQFRSRTFWAGIVVADGTALQRYLAFTLVPGLCAQVGQLVHGEGGGSGAEAARVDRGDPGRRRRRPHPWIGPGRTGDDPESLPESPRFADFRIEGTPSRLPAGFPGEAGASLDHPVPGDGSRDLPGLRQPDQEPVGGRHAVPDLRQPELRETRRTVYLRSKDGGRTWGEAELRLCSSGSADRSCARTGHGCACTRTSASRRRPSTRTNHRTRGGPGGVLFLSR